MTPLERAPLISKTAKFERHLLKTTVASEDIAPQRRKSLQRFVHIWCQYPTVAGINIATLSGLKNLTVFPDTEEVYFSIVRN